MGRIHDEGQDEQAPHHADIHLSAGLSQAEVQLADEVHHCGRHREVHQPLELWEIVERWGKKKAEGHVKEGGQIHTLD